MLEALKNHWPEYLKEAWGIATFMTCASILTTLLVYPESPVSQAVKEPAAKLALLGIGMGFVIAGIMYSPWGKRSGAHINPAVTWAFYRLGKIKLADAIFYTIAQFLGAIGAVQIMRLLIGAPYRHPSVDHVVTIPGPDGAWAAFAAEFLISFILMYVALTAVNDKRLEKWAGAIVGVLLMFYLAVETPFSGMSLNPARTFGSAFAARKWEGLWVYFTSPMLAMLLAAEIYRRVQKERLEEGPSFPMEAEEKPGNEGEKPEREATAAA